MNRTDYKKYIILILVLVIWIIGSYMKIWNSYLIPSPFKIIDTLIKLIKNGSMFKHIIMSFSRIVIGISFTSLIAIPLGLIFGIFPKLYEYFKLPLGFLKSVPPLALMPMIILWFGIGETSKIIIIILASFFPLFLNTFKGVEHCDKGLKEVGAIFGLSKVEVLKKIIIPSSIPDILVGLRLAIGYSWRAIVGAEMIAASSGLGYMILDGQILSRIDIIFIGIILIGSFGILTDIIISKLVTKLLKRRGAINE